jgi:enoyl-[acyl-carrier-protein] reductase (NADH)
MSMEMDNFPHLPTSAYSTSVYSISAYSISAMWMTASPLLTKGASV